MFEVTNLYWVHDATPLVLQMLPAHTHKSAFEAPRVLFCSPPQHHPVTCMMHCCLQAVQQLAGSAVTTAHLPTRALRALWIALSDLSLRSWSGLPVAQFPAEARAAQFGAVVAPLVRCLAEVAHSMGSGHSVGPGAELAVRRAAAAANSLVLSFSGTPKHVRGGWCDFSRLAGCCLAAPLLMWAAFKKLGFLGMQEAGMNACRQGSCISVMVALCDSS